MGWEWGGWAVGMGVVSQRKVEVRMWSRGGCWIGGGGGGDGWLGERIVATGF